MLVLGDLTRTVRLVVESKMIYELTAPFDERFSLAPVALTVLGFRNRPDLPGAADLLGVAFTNEEEMRPRLPTAGARPC